MIAASFLFFLAVFLGIGLASAFRARKTSRDYYLASRQVSPMFVGLSAVATNNSGYMFIGVIGYTYMTGLASIWLMTGWIAGDFIASLFIHRKLRDAAERTDEPTFAGLLSRWHGTDFKLYRRVAALITVLFLGTYAAAQFSAGGKALHALFGWDARLGAVMVSLIVVAYCFVGGIRASIWTDVAQSFAMIVAMTILFVFAVATLGGPAEAWRALHAVPDYMNLFPSDLVFPGLAGMVLFAVGWMFAGFSVIGQPHVMVRFMALDDNANMVRARLWYYGFFSMFYLLATGVGLLSRLYFPELGGMDEELALPTMANELLPPVLVGLILAGIFAATMSTADSLVLSCSAAATNDLSPRKIESRLLIKATTVGVSALALVIAVSGDATVFALVIMAWSVLASAFGPLMLVYALGGRPGETVALVMMVTGVATALIWRELGLHNAVYEGMPGILAGLAVYALARVLWRRSPSRAGSSRDEVPRGR
ncbi:MAG: sodium/proline symporter [Sphingomonadales bacterium]